MNQNTFKIAFLLFLAVFLVGPNAAHAQIEDPTKYDPKTEREFDSMEKWENWYVQKGTRVAVHTCEGGKVLFDASELDNIYIPTALGQNTTGKKASLDAHARRTANQIGTGVLAAIGSGGALLPLLAAAQYSAMTDICSSYYVLAPHEYVNRDILNKKCTGGIENGAKKAGGQFNFIEWEAGSFTKSDIPFYFHCDPTWDPVAREQIATDDNQKSQLIGRTMGYAGKASSYCNNVQLTDHLESIKSKVNTITVEGRIWGERLVKQWKTCSKPAMQAADIVPGGEGKWAGAIRFVAYYALSPSGKVQICAAAPDLFFPLRIGCTATAAPGDEVNIDEFLKAYVSDTRCSYLIYPRKDLQSLGVALPGGAADPVKKFLQSDMHFTSTVVGCLKDMLTKIFIKTPNSTSNAEKPFFQIFQERMKQIMLAALVLYIVIVGLKIMTAGKPPQRHEAVMYVLKFALVVYFGLGGGLYEVENNEVKGLFPNLIQVPDELSNIFLQAQNINDPGGYCYHTYEGTNILSERQINKGALPGVFGTEGTKGNNQYVTLTVWDLVDCKMINYLSLGSCQYNLGGMIVSWFASAALFVDKIGIMLAIVCLLYTIMVLITMFKFTHIFILAMFTVTILVFLSPIFLLFALFDPLKEIFQAWLRMILGYLLYPALLFAFVALMFATFDSIFYGDLNLNQGRSESNTGAVNYELACQGVDSVYCKLQKATGYRDNCTGGSISQLMLTKTNNELLGEISVLKDSIANDFFDVMLKMLLFAFLFYLFLNSVTGFMASMLRIGDMGSIAGAGAIGGPVAKMAGQAAMAGGRAAAGAATAGASEAVGGAAGAAASVAAKAVSKATGNKGAEKAVQAARGK